MSVSATTPYNASLASLASLTAPISEAKANTPSAGPTEDFLCPECPAPITNRFVLVDTLAAERITTDFVPVSKIKNAAMSAFAGLFTGFALVTALTAICYDSVSWSKGEIEFKSQEMFVCLGPKLPVAYLLAAMTAATTLTAVSNVVYNRYNSHTKG